MTLYLCEISYDMYDPHTLIGVFTTENKAKDAYDRFVQKENVVGGEMIITDVELDKDFHGDE